MSDQKSARSSDIPFRLGLVAAVSILAGMGIAQVQGGIEWGDPLSTLAYILIAIGVLSTILGALFAIFHWLKKAASSEAATSAMGRAKQVAEDIAKPKITSTSGMSTADELEKWARLRATGVVSQQEFDAARAELLRGSGR